MKKIFKIFIISFLFVITLQMGYKFVYAEVNTEYTTVEYNGNLIGGSDDGGVISGIVKGISSLVLQYVTKFIYVVAQLVESLVTQFSSYMFGVNQFPWEDLIVFNTLPYLDINFINPAAQGTIYNLAGNTSIGDVVKTVYFSLLTLSVSVVGIGVAIVAIKLAISSIAAEKAKYKEAITKCLYTVVMLFSVHILISFLFYLNENICVAASRILNGLVQNESEQLAENIKGKKDMGYTFLMLNSGVSNTYNDNYKNSWDSFWGNLRTNIGGAFNNFANSLSKLFTGSSANEEKAFEIVNEAENLKEDEIRGAIADYLCSQIKYMGSRFQDDTGKHDKYYYIDPLTGYAIHGNIADSPVNDAQQACDLLLEDINNITGASSLESLKEKYKNAENTGYYKYIVNAYQIVVLDDVDMSDLITNIAEKFKQDAYAITDKNYSENSDTAYIATYLYAILLVQSIMLLINYIKRLFYVILLSVFAPVVIIYDFFLGTF